MYIYREGTEWTKKIQDPPRPICDHDMLIATRRLRSMCIPFRTLVNDTEILATYMNTSIIKVLMALPYQCIIDVLRLQLNEETITIVWGTITAGPNVSASLHHAHHLPRIPPRPLRQNVAIYGVLSAHSFLFVETGL